MSTSDKINLIVALATIAGVVVAFITLRTQLNALNKQLALQHFSDYTKRYQEIISEFPEDINDPAFKLDGRDDCTKVMRQMRMYLDLCFEEWYLNRRTMIDNETWELWSSGMATAFSKSAFQQAWERIRKDTVFGDAFENFIDQLPKPK